MNKSIIKSLCIFTIALLSAPFVSCSKDDRLEETFTEVPSRKMAEDFTLIGVRSYESGNSLGLSLDIELDDSELRSLSYLEKEETGELLGIQASQQEALHIFVRKEGEEHSLAVATIQWKYRTDNKINLNNLNISIPQGFNINPGEAWYISGILGGRLDSNTKSVYFGSASQQESILVSSDNSVDIPYTFGWKRLEITGRNQAKLSDTKLSPMGTLLRLQFYNNLIDSFDASQIEIKSNAFQAHGRLAPSDVNNTAEQVGESPIWHASSAEDETAKVWRYKLGGSQRNLSLPSGSGNRREHSVMIWAMPNRQISQEATQTSIKLTAQRVGSAETEVFETYQKTAHRPLINGKSYRLSNLITAEPYISEVYYQYAPEIRQPDGTKIDRHNYSIVEIYNPTIEDIDLKKYALVRTAQLSSTISPHLYFASGVTSPTSDLSGAAFLPLGVLDGTTGAVRTTTTFFPQNNTSYGGEWHKVVYGEATQVLKGGKTLLVGAAGYVHTEHKPSANIERFNAQLSAYTPGASTRSIELHYLPRAGMQIDSAYRAGYAQAMIAIDNSSDNTKDRDPNPDGNGAILQLGYRQGVALIKCHLNEEATYEYEVIDTSTPINDLDGTKNYNNALRNALFQLGADPLPQNAYSTTCYTQVRKKNVSKGRSTFDQNEWEWAISENEGVKSLGTRSYIAGLTPFAKQYTGYDVNNNPRNNPFWSRVSKAATIAQTQYNPDVSSGNSVLNNKLNFSERYVKVPISGGMASEVQANYEFEKSYDGNLETFYHSNNAGGVRFPVTLTYRFAQPETLSYIIYVPRDHNGSINDYEIEVTYDDNSINRVVNAQLGTPTTSAKISWPGISDKPIKEVRFKVKSTGRGVVAVKEMEFYKLRDNAFNPQTLFADLACTELRKGITYQEIMSAPDPFYREIARKMYQGTYPREFRIADYKAWSQSTIMQQENKTQFQYSILDNPTGISVRAGEELVVLVGPTNGYNIALRVMDLSMGSSWATDGFAHSAVYPLKEGENRIKLTRSGITHILYNVPQKEVDRSRYPDIRVHFVDGFGEVNGYYDAQNPKHKGRWKELIGKAKQPYYEVLGEFSHIAFPTDYFRRNTRDADELIALYDKLVKSEMELIGLYRYNRLFTNRMFFHVIYYGNMFAFYQRTFYTIGAMNEMTDPNRLIRGGWGQGHEVGHMNQTWGLRWEGLEEVTCNIKAAYIQTTIFGNNCRLQHEGGKLNNRYRQAWTEAFLGAKTHAAIMNVFSKVVPFWQLELYFGKAMGRTPLQQEDKGGFYPDLFERLRTVNHPQKNHDQQAEFAYHISVVSGYDMTDFCERWGFLRPATGVEARKSHADTFHFSLPQSVVDDVKQRIKALNLPKPSPVVHLISDVNYRYFSDPSKKVVPGTIRRQGTTLMLSDWQNVVCYVVVNENGEEIYYNEGKTSPEDTVAELRAEPTFSWRNPALRLYAISASGDRTQVTIP